MAGMNEWMKMLVLLEMLHKRNFMRAQTPKKIRGNIGTKAMLFTYFCFVFGKKTNPRSKPSGHKPSGQNPRTQIPQIRTKPSCVNTNIHKYIHTYMHACIRTYIQSGILTGINIRTLYIHTHIGLQYIHTYEHACLHTCMHTWMWPNVSVYRPTAEVRGSILASLYSSRPIRSVWTVWQWTMSSC